MKTTLLKNLFFSAMFLSLSGCMEEEVSTLQGSGNSGGISKPIDLNSDDQFNYPETPIVQDGKSHIGNLTPVGGNFAEYMKVDPQAYTQNISSTSTQVNQDLNSVYINTDVISEEKLDEFMKTPLFKNMNKTGTSIFLDSNPGTTNLDNLKRISMKIAGGSIDRASAFILTKGRDNSFALVPFFDIKRGVKSDYNNSLYNITGFISEAKSEKEDMKNFGTNIKKHVEFENYLDNPREVKTNSINNSKAKIGSKATYDFGCVECNWGSIKIHHPYKLYQAADYGTVNSFRLLEQSYDAKNMSKLLGLTDELKQNLVFTTKQPIITPNGVIYRSGDYKLQKYFIVQEYVGTRVQGPGSSSVTKGSTIGTTRGYSFGAKFDKFLPKLAAKTPLFGYLIESVSPEASKQFSTNETKTYSEGATVNIAAGYYGYAAEGMNKALKCLTASLSKVNENEVHLYYGIERAKVLVYNKTQWDPYTGARKYTIETILAPVTSFYNIPEKSRLVYLVNNTVAGKVTNTGVFEGDRTTMGSFLFARLSRTK